MRNQVPFVVGLVECGAYYAPFRKMLPAFVDCTPMGVAVQELDALFKQHNLISATKFKLVWLTCFRGPREYSIDSSESRAIESGREYNVDVCYDLRNLKDLTADEILRRARILAVEGLLYFARKFDVPTEALFEYRKPLGALRVIETYGSSTVQTAEGIKELSIEFAIEDWGTKADAARIEKLQKLASKTLRSDDVGYCSYSEINLGEAALALQVSDVRKAVEALAAALAKPAIAKGVRVVDMDGNTLWSRD